MTDPVADAVGFGVEELRAAANQLDLTWRLRPGTVQSQPIAADLPQVLVDGDSTPLPAASLVGPVPDGTRVMTMAVPPAGTYIVGFLDRLIGSNETGIGGFFTSGDTTTVTTFASLNGTSSVQIAKAHRDTLLLVELHATFFSSSTGAGVEFGVLVAGTDFVVAPYHQTLPGLGRLNASGVLPIPDVAAGPQVVQARWRRQGGAGTITRNVDDWLSLIVREIN